MLLKPLIPIRYARITTDDGARRVLMVTLDSPTWIGGREIDRYGHATDRVHLIDKTAITKREPLVMDLKYGTLRRMS